MTEAESTALCSIHELRTCPCSRQFIEPSKDAEQMRALAKQIERHSSGLVKALRESAEIAERIGEAA